MENLEWVKGKVAFVTGAAGGLGFELARLLALHGARVVLADIEGEKVRVASEQLSARGLTSFPLCLDITDAEGWERAAEQARSAFGEVDILCNNAGIVGAYSYTMGVSPEVLGRVLDTNVIGALRGVQTFVPAMIARRTGHVLITNSMTSVDTHARAADYSASKHALLSLSESLRDELSPAGVIVSALCPGGLTTGLNDPAKRLSGGQSSLARDAPLAKPGNAMSPAVVAEIALAGLARGDFYIFTHPDGRQRLQERVDEMMSAFDRLA